jgi:hypothetical protein
MGIQDLQIIAEENGKISVLSSNSKNLKLQFKVQDSRKDAYFKFTVLDSAGNIVEYEKEIPGFTLQFAGSPLDTASKIFQYGERMIGARHSELLTITNYGKFDIILENPMLLSNLIFSFPQSQFPLTIPAGEQREITIVYKPIAVKKYSSLRDRDTLVITMNCIDEIIPLEGIPLEFDVKTNSKCDVPIRFRTDSIPTSLEAAIKPTVTEGIIEFEINSNEESLVEIDLFNQLGVKQTSLFSGIIGLGYTEKIFDIKNLPNDVYFARISTPAGSAIMKIIKIK